MLQDPAKHLLPNRMEVEADLCQVAVHGDAVPAVMRIQSIKSPNTTVAPEVVVITVALTSDVRQVERPMLLESDESSGSIGGETKEEEGGLHLKYGSIYRLRQQVMTIMISLLCAEVEI